MSKLSNFVDNLNTNTIGGAQLEDDLRSEQYAINASRLGLLKVLDTFRPPESTKTAVYKWFESVKEHSRRMDELNTAYVGGMRAMSEESNQTIINEMEGTLR